MRYSKIIAVAGISMLIAGCQTGQNEDTAKILAELKDIKTRLDKIDKDLSKKSAQPMAMRDTSRGSDVEALNNIKLPDNPTREDIKKYIAKIQAATKNQNSFSDRDPQVEMYLNLGEKNLDLLLEASRTSDVSSWHMNYAINKMEFSPASKDLILKAMRRNPELIRTIIRMGWEKEAKNTIKEMMLYPRNGYIPQEAIQTALDYKDPDMNEAVLNYFINGNNRANTYRLLVMCPDIKIDAETIENAWNQAIMSHDYERNAMAAIAVEYGHKNALEALLDRNTTINYGDDYNFRCNSAIRNHVDFNGSLPEIKKWYETNRDNIVFDPADKKFKVKKSEATAAVPAPAPAK